jgi:4-hydroxy-tetrahydrodipicolinate synthase
MDKQITPSNILERIKHRPIWSATPTPLDDGRRLDRESTIRMVDRHVDLDVCGIFLGGTCGEGPWLHPDDYKSFVRLVVSEARQRCVVAAQVSDNSAQRMLCNIDTVAGCGADLAVIASPYAFMNNTDAHLLDLYRETIEKSSLPIVFYDRGRHSPFPASNEILAEIYSMEKVLLIKDSSGDESRRELALEARRKRPELVLANGDEFRAVEYFKAGYDAAMFGGSILVAQFAAKIYEACRENRFEEAVEIERRMCDVLYAVYGGKTIACWLTGLKQSLVECGIFSSHRNFLDYPLTETCQAAMTAILETERDLLCLGERAGDLSNARV